MEIVKAQPQHLDRIMEIYASAKSHMVKNGNPTQWNEHYPTRDLLEKDIEIGHCYVCLQDGEVHGVFVLLSSEEPTYAVIEDGSWKSDTPYGTLHRIAGDGAIKGLGGLCLDFCKQLFPHMRADTHEDNKIMQRLLEQSGFERRGIVWMVDNTPRIAYEYLD
ncbi:N-acetyltransferase [Oscillospiraceae bacterium MB08-C2-2]|nr:N-acetyltransferase [Oscillospiraceae bacterium MB08-C2-2]